MSRPAPVPPRHPLVALTRALALADIILGAGGYIEPGTVFLDANPAVKPDEKYKMVATSGGGATMFSSADGFLFKNMTSAYVRPVPPQRPRLWPPRLPRCCC